MNYRARLTTFVVRAALFGLLLIALLPTLSFAELTVVVVRHTEKESGGEDPVLTEAGRARAAELARMLAKADVRELHASEYNRTQMTLVPLAEQFGLEVTVVPARKSVDHYSAEALLEHLPDGVIVIASHSNLVPAIVQKLSGQEVAHMDEQTYDDLYIVMLNENESPSLVRLQYGEPSGE